MKTDIDSLMQANDIDALLVTGAGQHNPAMVYLTGGGHLTTADLIKLRGQPAVLFHQDMERDEAARTGLATRNLAAYPMAELLQQAGGDAMQAAALRYLRMFNDVGLTKGKVALYGKMDAGSAWALFSALQKAAPDLTLIGEGNRSILLQAMATKDLSEVERIRRMGKITTGVVGQVADFLSSHSTRDEILIKTDGEPLTIGEVKRQINRWLTDAGADNPEGTIFAIGYDAAIPHSTGTASDFLRLGQTIVFDIFPSEPGGGYFYDFTRTWCLGYAPDEIWKLYEDVQFVFQTILANMQAGTSTRQHMEHACQLFEARGYPTQLNQPQTQRGFVHGLGHGLGLHIHENPRMGLQTSPEEILQPGAVVTLEPGLYEPEQKMGVRIEDTIWIRQDGQPEILAEFPYDLVLPVKKA